MQMIWRNDHVYRRSAILAQRLHQMREPVVELTAQTVLLLSHVHREHCHREAALVKLRHSERITA